MDAIGRPGPLAQVYVEDRVMTFYVRARVSTPSKSNSSATKSCLGVPRGPGAQLVRVSRMSVLVLILPKKSGRGTCHRRVCLVERVHELARGGRGPRARLPVGGSDGSVNPLHLFCARPSLIQSNSRGFTQSISCGCTSEDFHLNFAYIRLSFAFVNTVMPVESCWYVSEGCVGGACQIDVIRRRVRSKLLRHDGSAPRVLTV